MTWILPSSIRSRFVPESECSTLAPNSPANTTDTEHVFWLTLSGKQVQRPLSWRGWKARAWSPLLFGAVLSKNSHSTHCVEKWMQSWPDFRVRTFPSQANKQEQKENDTSYPQSSKLLATLEPDGFFWKTSEGSFLPGMEPPLRKFSERFPISGGMRNGQLFEHPRWVPIIDANDGSAWPTATLDDVNNVTRDSGSQQSLARDSRRWATPRAGKISSENPEVWDARKAGGEVSTPPLPMQAAQWQTVRANEGNAGDYQTNASNPDKPFVTLNGQAKAWPTPAARDEKGANGMEHMNTKDRPHMDQLANAAVYRFSPQAQATGLDGNLLWMADQLNISPLRLNPAFVCWLMGWPWWWTRAEPINCEQEETELFRSKLRSLLHTFFDESTPSNKSK